MVQQASSTASESMRLWTTATDTSKMSNGNADAFEDLLSYYIPSVQRSYLELKLCR